MEGKRIFSSFIDTFKDVLKLGPKEMAGLDIGLSSIKLADIQKVGSGEYKLLKYSKVPLPEGSLIEDEIQKEDEVLEAITTAFANIEMVSPLVCLGISGPNTIVKRLQVAGGTEEEIGEQVYWEAQQYLPFNIEESSFSHYYLGENEGGGADVIVGAAKNGVVLQYKDLLEKANLKIKVLDLSVIALVNVFELVIRDKIQEAAESWLLIEIGAQKTNFVIYKYGTIAFSKEIPIGGVIITEEIQRQMGVNYSEAEDLKIVGDEHGNLPEEILNIIDQVIEQFFNEIKKTIDFYVSSSSDENIVGCYISGGACRVPGLIEGLEALLGVNVSFLNPFEVIDYDDREISEKELTNIAYEGAVAIGLAMREAN